MTLGRDQRPTLGSQHARTDSSAPSVPEPSFAEQVRTLLHLGRTGTLSSMSRKHPGWPFGSVMPYALDDHGRPVFLISVMAMHTQNLKTDPRASLLVSQPGWTGDPLAGARATLLGRVTALPEADLETSRAGYLARYENARAWVDFDDFGFLSHGRERRVLCRRLRGHGLGRRHRLHQGGVGSLGRGGGRDY